MLKNIGTYILGVLIVVDILCNATFLRGCPWETMSSVAYRKHRDGSRFGFMLHVINALFFNKYHCVDAYTSDRKRILPI